MKKQLKKTSLLGCTLIMLGDVKASEKQFQIPEENILSPIYGGGIMW